MWCAGGVLQGALPALFNVFDSELGWVGSALAVPQWHHGKYGCRQEMLSLLWAAYLLVFNKTDWIQQENKHLLIAFSTQDKAIFFFKKKTNAHVMLWRPYS